MKEKNNIDDLFKSGIAGFKVEPSAEVWDRIEAGFFTKSAFIFKWYYIAAALLFLLLASGGVWFFNQDDDFQVQVVDEINVPNEHKQVIEKDNEENFVASVNDFDDIDKELQPNINEQQIKKDDEIIEATESPTETDTDIAINKTEAIIIYNEVAYPAEVNNNQIANSSISIPYLDPENIRIATTLEYSLVDPQQIEAVELYLEKQRRTHFYAGLSADGGMIYYPSTKDQFTWSTDLALGLTFAKKFYVETGLGYLDSKERGIYSIELKSYDSVGYYNQVESFEVDPINPDEIQYNTKEVIVYDSIDHYTHTTPYFKYQYITIPLSFGYKFYQKEKFTASVRTGVIFSYMINKNIPEAEYYDPEYTIVKMINNTPERVEWNFQWQIGIRLNYNISKAFSVSAEPIFTKYLNSIYDTDKGYSSVKPYTMGLRVGIYYGF